MAGAVYKKTPNKRKPKADGASEGRGLLGSLASGKTARGANVRRPALKARPLESVPPEQISPPRQEQAARKESGAAPPRPSIAASISPQASVGPVSLPTTEPLGIQAPPTSTASEADTPRRKPRPARQEMETDSAAKGWMIRLTPSILVMLTMLLLVTLTFFFGFGLIVGRGSIPPTNPLALESLLPPVQETQPEAEPEHILRQEELHFMTNLRQEGDDASQLLPDPGKTREMPQASVPEPVPARSADQAASAPDTSSLVEQPGTSAPAGTATSGQTTTSADLTKYDFVLQVAAFKAEDRADALRLKLEEGGMRTRLVREKAQSGTWFHVQVMFRGLSADFQQLRDELPDYGLRDSMLVSKTPVP